VGADPAFGSVVQSLVIVVAGDQMSNEKSRGFLPGTDFGGLLGEGPEPGQNPVPVCSSLSPHSAHTSHFSCTKKATMISGQKKMPMITSAMDALPNRVVCRGWSVQPH
jgi:hypothetical protein